jgi:hypothetical protein
MNKVWTKVEAGCALAIAAGIGLLLFSPVLNATRCLVTTDDNIGIIAASKADLPASFLSQWGTFILGSPGGGSPWAPTPLLLWLLPVTGFINWIHGVYLALGAILIMLYLRKSGIGWTAAVMAALVSFWVGTNFTLTYAGHIAKFSILMLMPAFLLLARQAVFDTGRTVLWATAAGGVVGLMLLEQQDVALLGGLFLGAWVVFARVRHDGGLRVAGLLKTLLPIGAAALMLAGPTMVRSYATNVTSVASAEVEDPQAKWDFMTQWSVPPNETIDLIAPHYFGISSGDPEGPYWGRTGQSAGWDRTHQGFMNFRLESIYIGAIPVVLALFAVVAAIGKNGKGLMVDGEGRGKTVASEQWTVNSGGDRNDGGRWKVEGGQGNHEPLTIPHEPSALWANRRAEILFWGAAAVIALLLAYGKYFPLYALFFKLPVVNNIRNPNKFLHVFQLCLGILSAYGLDTAVRMKRPQTID